MGVDDVIEDHWLRTWAMAGTASGGDVVEDDERLVVRSGLDEFPYNQVLRCVPRGDPDAVIDGILETIGGRPGPWIVWPSSRPADLAERLGARGCAFYTTMTGMWRELDAGAIGPPPPADVRITEVDSDLLPVWSDLVLDQWHLEARVRDALLAMHREVGFETARRFLAMDGQAPIAKATMVMHEPDVVGIYGVGTRPEARGCGIASALTAHLLEHGRTSGARTAVLHSTPMAVKVYGNLGFTEAFTAPVFELPHAPAGSDRLSSL